MGRGRRDWEPPHCPNRNCDFHKPLTIGWRYIRRGTYTRRCRPHCIQRFTCLACHRHFSVQSFKATYWLKRPELLAKIADEVVNGACNRQIARVLRCSPSTVALQLARLARHCLLFQAGELARITGLGEIVFDGFETFERSQYFPFHHNVAVTADTGYFLFHTDSELRRKGRMTAAQKARRAELEARFGRPDPRAVERGVHRLLDALAHTCDHLIIRSDDHRAYPRAIKRLSIPVTHHVTSSSERRTYQNPLWEVNLLDLVIRHSLAAHKRETIAFVKRRQGAAEKLTLFQVWRNYGKKRSEKGPRVTPAMLMGLVDRPLTFRHLLRRRLFANHFRLPPPWHKYYRGVVHTRALAVNRRHTLTYAY